MLPASKVNGALVQIAWSAPKLTVVGATETTVKVSVAIQPPAFVTVNE